MAGGQPLHALQPMHGRTWCPYPAAHSGVALLGHSSSSFLPHEMWITSSSVPWGWGEGIVKL